MLIGLATLAALLTVPLFGGRISALAEVRLKAIWLAVGALAMQILIINIVPQDAGSWHRVVHLASYGVIALFVIANRDVPFLWLIALGGACNFTAIVANDGVMPAKPSALAAARVQETPGEFINSTAVPHAHLQWLGDAFATPSWFPVQNVFSIGDLMIVLGALLAFHTICGSRLAVRRGPRRVASEQPA
jgi:hypothetical protein